MKRYRFRLEPVLRVRRIEQDTVQGRLAVAHRDLADAEATLLDAVDRYRSAPQPVGAQSAATWLAGRTRAELTAATVMDVGSRREHAAAQVEEQRSALHDARRRVVALERLDERRRSEHDLEARRDEDAEVDELVTNRFGRTP